MPSDKQKKSQKVFAEKMEKAKKIFESANGKKSWKAAVKEAFAK